MTECATLPIVAADLKRYQYVVSDSARWAKFEHRPGDIIISTPPKCGTTLTQMMCALLIFDSPEFPGRLDDLSPWLDMNTRSDDEVLAEVDAQTYRRFIKTHTPLDGVPQWPDVTYVVVARDPRDVFVSWEHHMANMDVGRFLTAIDGAVGFDAVAPFVTDSPATVEERFDRWLTIDDAQVSMSLAAVTGHVAVSWERRDEANVQLLHFDDMRTDRAATMSRLAQAFGLDVTQERIDELAAAASLDRMRARADELAPNTKEIFSDPALFFRSGTSGGWGELMTADNETIYWERIAELTSPELSDWLHRS
jgi:hypothetical protein